MRMHRGSFLCLESSMKPAPCCFVFVRCCAEIVSELSHVSPPCVAAKKEEQELNAQKDAGASKGQQQQQQQVPNQDTPAEPTSSSSTAAKAALSPSAVTGGIAFAARSHQGIAEKAKEVRHLARFKQACLCVDFLHHTKERELSSWHDANQKVIICS